MKTSDTSSRGKKICRIITRMNVGGPSQQCVHLSKGLEEFGWETTLLHGSIDSDKEGSMEYLAEGYGVKTIRIPSMQREISPLADLRAFWEIYQTLRQLRPQVVHTHQAKAGTLGRIAAALCNVPVIIHTFHGLSIRDYFGSIKNTVLRQVEKFCARISSASIALGPSDRGELLEMGIVSDEKCAIIPNGIPLERFVNAENLRGTVRKELGLAADDTLIVSIGRLVPIKNLSAFISMAAKVAEKRENIHFLLVGEGPLKDDLKKQAQELGIEDRVTFYGVTDEIEKVYVDADLVVLCSKREGMPLTIIEALAAARPVVCTDVGNLSYLVIDDKTGRLVPPEKPPALTEGVLEVLDESEKASQWGVAGQERVLSFFTLQSLKSRINALYEAQSNGQPYTDPLSDRWQETTIPSGKSEST